jgi:hypothetical protein
MNRGRDESRPYMPIFFTVLIGITVNVACFFAVFHGYCLFNREFFVASYFFGMPPLPVRIVQWDSKGEAL